MLGKGFRLALSDEHPHVPEMYSTGSPVLKSRRKAESRIQESEVRIKGCDPFSSAFLSFWILNSDS
jgi:hypothetical protein